MFSNGTKSGRTLSKYRVRLDYGSFEDSMMSLYAEIGKGIVHPGSASNFESFTELRRKNYPCWSLI